MWRSFVRFISTDVEGRVALEAVEIAVRRPGRLGLSLQGRAWSRPKIQLLRVHKSRRRKTAVANPVVIQGDASQATLHVVVAEARRVEAARIQGRPAGT